LIVFGFYDIIVLVIKMDILNRLTVLEVYNVSVASFESGKVIHAAKRKWHGIAFSLGGRLYYTHNGKNIPLYANRIVYLPKGEEYTVTCTKGGDFAVVNFLIADDSCGDTQFICAEAQSIESCKKEFFHLLGMFAADNCNKKCAFMSAVYNLFAEVVSMCEATNLPAVLLNAKRYVDDSFSSAEITNKVIAQQCGISEVYLRKLFTEKLGVSVKQYIKEKRVEKAKMLLLETANTVTEISSLCGYSCIYHFCRSFKQVTGYTPTEYKNMHKTTML